MTTPFQTNIVSKSEAENALQQSSEPGYQGPVAKPPYHVLELEDSAQVQVFLPGIDKSAVETKVEHNRIFIKARPTWTVPKTWSTVHRESKSTNYELVLELDPGFDQSSVSANLADGVLTIKIAKQPTLKPRKIEITN